MHTMHEDALTGAAPGGWFAVALGRDVPVGTTRAVIVSGREVVLWRGGDAQLHAWEDRCPHRGMRLSFGFVRGDALNCLYHGWQYGPQASCRRIPAHPDLVVPPTIRANAYAAREQAGMVWVNFDPDAAGEPPGVPVDAAPLASVAVEAGDGALAALLGAAPLADRALGQGTLHIARHTVSPEKAMLHALVSGGADLGAGWAALRALRVQLETAVAA